MSNATIRIKKRLDQGGAAAGAPSTLKPSELAFNEVDKKLYYGLGESGGDASSIIAIGGDGAFLSLSGAQTAAGNKTFSNNVIVTGDLTVNGTTTTLNTTNSAIKDALIELGNGTSGTPANDAGLVIERGSSDNAFIGWDESTDKFTIGTGSFTGSSTGNLSITTGTLVGNLEGNVTGNVTGNTSGSSGSCTGNAGTATTLATGRTISATGDISWTSTAFDGSGNVTGTAAISTGAIVNADVNSSADIAGSKLADDSITEAKLDIHNAPSGTSKVLGYTSNGLEWVAQSGGVADGSITTAKLDTDAVDGTKIADDAVDSEHIADGAVDTAHIAVGAITGSRIGANQVENQHYADLSIDTAFIKDLQITTGKLATDAVTGAKIADNAVDTEHLATNCISSGHINDDVINSEHYVAGSIDLEHMSSESVDEDNLKISNAGTNGQFLQKQSGNAGGLTWATPDTGTATAMTIQDESSDTTCFPLFVTAATGDLGPKSGSNLTFNSSSGLLTATNFSGVMDGGTF